MRWVLVRVESERGEVESWCFGQGGVELEAMKYPSPESTLSGWATHAIVAGMSING